MNHSLLGNVIGDAIIKGLEEIKNNLQSASSHRILYEK